ncbi:unnamed protein product [Coccothraustes coccothraustes]
MLPGETAAPSRISPSLSRFVFFLPGFALLQPAAAVCPTARRAAAGKPGSSSAAAAERVLGRQRLRLRQPHTCFPGKKKGLQKKKWLPKKKSRQKTLRWDVTDELEGISSLLANNNTRKINKQCDRAHETHRALCERSFLLALVTQASKYFDL